MATSTPMHVITHTRRVCSLYKKMSRDLLNWYSDRAIWRYHVTLLRADFDKNRNEKDSLKIKQLVEQAEKKHETEKHWAPMNFPSSPLGVAYERNVIIPDSAVDFWDPVEKAFYPKYFALREQRKLEYIEAWEKKYGKVDPKEYEKHH